MVTAAMVAALAASLVLPWQRLPSTAPVIFPVLVGAALATLGLAEQSIATPYGGLLVLCFVYTGLTQPGVISALLVAPAALAWVATNGTWTAILAVRLLIAMAIWILSSQLLAQLTRQQQVLTLTQRALTRQLHIAAHTDALTGIANRRDFDLRIDQTQTRDTVVICDIDHFKRLNDSLGHETGDRVLSEFGSVLRVCLREPDYAARYGGEEFALLLSATSLAQAHTVLDRLHEQWAILQPEITFSAGLAHVSAHQTPRAALRAADRALYDAKAAGRNCDRTEASLP